MYQIFAPMNPCPCGFFPDMEKCVCTTADIKRYLNKISGPILDRIDICVEAPRMKIENLTKEKKTISSKDMLKKVKVARSMQKERYANTDYQFNAELPAALVSGYCALGKEERTFMERVSQKMDLSVRAYHKILRVARTLADLEGNRQIEMTHLAEAVSYRMDGGKLWRLK